MTSDEQQSILSHAHIKVSELVVRADRRTRPNSWIRNRNSDSGGASTGREPRLTGPAVYRLVAILRARISPRPTPKQLQLISADGRLGPNNMQVRWLFRKWHLAEEASSCWRSISYPVYKSSCFYCGTLFGHRRNVVFGAADRTVDLLSSLLSLRYYIYCWICCTWRWSSAVTNINYTQLYLTEFRVVFHLLTYSLPLS